VGLYAPLPDELSTELIERAAREAGKRVALPRMQPGRRLEFVWNRSFEDLRPGRYGVLEAPAGGELASLGELGLLVVPGVAFDRAGGRLGRGAGYYDRALAARVGSGPHRFGFAESSQIVEEVPMEEFDQRMDAVVTAREIIRRERPE
jgi:5-formyltetrahydrofolate cyclo-ligase